MSQEQDKTFFRNFSLVVGVLAVMMIIFIFAARIVGHDEKASTAQKQAAAAKTTAPVGEVKVAAQDTAPAPAPAPAAPEAVPAAAGSSGQQVYDGMCKSCHGSGIPGIPQTGDQAAWEPRIAQGMDTLYKNAINGFTGTSGMMMPPRGGGTFTDDEVKAAVDFIISSVQAGEAAPAAAGEPAAPAGADGKKIYDSLCTSCHGTGLPGVPQLGDKAGWEPRIAQGMDILYNNAINGFTGTSGMMMPPRGGGTFSDDEIKAAVDYMVSKSQ